MDETPLSAPIRCLTLGKTVHDPVAHGKLKQIARLPGVRKVVGLGDLHQAYQESPVSIAVASEGLIYPQLSSNVVNCGMGVLNTNLWRDELTEDRLSTFRQKLQSDLRRKSDILSTDALGSVFRTGVDAVIERFDLPPSVAEHIENRGNVFGPGGYQGSTSDVLPPWLPRWSRSLDRLPFPALGSNHFVEFQVVDKVLDNEVAARWGLEVGRVVLAIHGDYSFTQTVNWHYVSRLKARSRGILAKAKLNASKAVFHFGSPPGLRNIRSRFDLYFVARAFTGVEAESVEGRRVAGALGMAMNFGYAMRLLFYRYLTGAISEAIKGQEGLPVLWDISHDSIQRENIEGRDYWVARKGAARRIPGMPAFVAGAANMNSLLGVCGDGGEEYLHSYDHGSSFVARALPERLDERASGKEEGTACYTLVGADPPTHRPHRDPQPVRLLQSALTDAGLVRPVAWLKPVANFKE